MTKAWGNRFPIVKAGYDVDSLDSSQKLRPLIGPAICVEGIGDRDRPLVEAQAYVASRQTDPRGGVRVSVVGAGAIDVDYREMMTYVWALIMLVAVEEELLALVANEEAQDSGKCGSSSDAGAGRFRAFRLAQIWSKTVLAAVLEAPVKGLGFA